MTTILPNAKSYATYARAMKQAENYVPAEIAFVISAQSDGRFAAIMLPTASRSPLFSF